MCGLKDTPLYLFRCSVCSTRYSIFNTLPPYRSLPTKSRPVCVCVLNRDSVFILNYILACIISAGRRVFFISNYINLFNAHKIVQKHFSRWFLGHLITCLTICVQHITLTSLWDLTCPPSGIGYVSQLQNRWFMWWVSDHEVMSVGRRRRRQHQSFFFSSREQIEASLTSGSI